MKILLAILLFTNSALAECTAVSYLQAGDKAVCTGYLFSPEKELEVRTKVSNYDRMTELVKAQDSMISTLQEHNKIELDNNIKLSQMLEQEKTADHWNNYLYFLLGAVLTGVTAYATVHALK